MQIGNTHFYVSPDMAPGPTGPYWEPAGDCVVEIEI
jgi:hypothetical protein